MSSAAYLLFYRRRSAVPLGGPRFQEISDRFDNTFNEEDEPESGEGQRLGQGSSHRGSPSASTGAGLTLHHPQGSRGLDSVHHELLGSSAADADQQMYQPTLPQVGEPDDEAAAWSAQVGLKNSIEGNQHDEGIDLPDYGAAQHGMTSIIQANSWNFSKIPRAAGSDVMGADDDLASDVAQNDNTSLSIDDDAFADHAEDVEPMLLNDDDHEPGAGYIVQDDTQQSEIVPPPDTDNYMSELATDLWTRRIYNVPADAGEDHTSDKVAEIHVGDDRLDDEQEKTGP